MTYKFIPSEIQVIDDNFFDSLQGKIIISNGGLIRRLKTLGTSEFDRVTVIQNPLQRIFDIGTIKLIEVNKLTDTNSMYLKYVKSPVQAARKIQSMIDMGNSMTQKL
ncbi:MAG: hypothetical protein Q9M76_02935 [Candidatus Dojkabacteria bacterium]|nr:hypothetical protein [Candidatus Dojkabacteria bacterium]